MNKDNIFEKVILGTVQLGIPYGINNSTGKPKLEDALEILSLAIHNNISVLDTADAYGDAPQIIGEFHKQSSQKFDIITKFSSAHDNSGLLQKVEKSLDTMGVGYLFAYLFHNPKDFFDNKTILEELSSVKKQGLVKYAGISIYSNEDFTAAIENSEIDLIQIPFNLLDNSNQRGDLLSKAKERGKIVHTRSTFLQGLFFRPTNLLPEKLQPLNRYLEVVHEISKSSSIDMHRLAMSYVLNNPYIDGVLLGVDTIDQLKENISLLNQIESDKENYNQLIDERVLVKEVELLNPNNWK